MANLWGPLDELLPRFNLTDTNQNITLNGERVIVNINITRPLFPEDNITQPFLPERINPPFIPRFVMIWGFIGACSYVLKVTTIKIQKGQFKNQYIPYHITRLFIGIAAAIIVSFILFTGGFFGFTIDVNKVTNPELVQFVYAAVAFFSGYSVRHIISITSGIIDNVFFHDRRDADPKRGQGEECTNGKHEEESNE
jgi:hypothetical protein